jgi:hypothetical protein
VARGRVSGASWCRTLETNTVSPCPLCSLMTELRPETHRRRRSGRDRTLSWGGDGPGRGPSPRGNPGPRGSSRAACRPAGSPARGGGAAGPRAGAALGCPWHTSPASGRREVRRPDLVGFSDGRCRPATPPCSSSCASPLRAGARVRSAAVQARRGRPPRRSGQAPARRRRPSGLRVLEVSRA